MNGIVFNKHGNVVALIMQVIGKTMSQRSHRNHVVSIMIVQNQNQVVVLHLPLVVTNQHSISSFDIQKH
jgi:hypothetical protein